MTTTAYDYITLATQVGSASYRSWTISNMTTSTTNNATVSTNTSTSNNKYTRTLQLSIPNFMSGLGTGAEFNSINVKFKAYVDKVFSTTYEFRVKQSGVTKDTIDVNSLSTAYQTYNSDTEGWNFSGTPQEILSDLAAGNIYFQFLGHNLSQTVNYTVEDFQIQLDYSLNDMKRQAIFAVIP